MMTLNRGGPTFAGLAGGPFSTTDDSMDTSKKETRGFFHKWLSRQYSSSKPLAAQLHDELTPTKRDRFGELSDDDENIMPCPYIRPLKNKLEPRVESAPHARRPAAGSIFPFARKKSAARDCLSPSGIDEDSSNDITASGAMSLRGLRLREDIAAAAAADSSHLKEWGYYIKCYSEGCFNLILPPGPPPMKPDFTYLPSTYPPNEAERLALFQSSEIWSGIDIVWTPLQAERARGLIKAATAGFAAPWSAVSFFDLDHEIVQAERGYSRHLIPRRQSIASHVLLTNEVMTILDAQKDWRFAGNPLVTEHPKIRFFAGAPLLSSNGEVVGVFSIFSHEPRASFTATQRRELTRFSEMAIKELTSPTKATSEGSHREIPILQPSVVSSGAPRIGNLSLASAPQNTLHNFDPGAPTLWYHKPSRDSKPKSRVFINVKKQALADPTDNTPPQSDASDAGPFSLSVQFSNSRKELQKPLLSPDSNQTRDSLDTPDSPTFGYCFPNFGPSRPRAFSGSNLTSLDHESHLYSPESPHMDTPSLSSDCSANVVDAFSFDETALLLAPPQSLPNYKTGFSKESFSPSNQNGVFGGHPELFDQYFDARGTFFATSEGRESVEDIGKDNPNRVWNDRAMSNLCLTDEVLSEGRRQSDPYAEAKSATESWAKNLGFDIIYAVELIPRKLFMTDSELQGPGGVETRVLVSYGLHEDINFDIAMHLSVLKGSGGMTWENEEGKPEDFRRGFMMPLTFDFGMLEYRSKGVVFGAFRKKAEDCVTLPKLDSADIRRLRKAARGLKKILHRVPTLRRPSYGMVVEPQQSPTRQAFPTSEATVMAKRLSNVESGSIN